MVIFRALLLLGLAAVSQAATDGGECSTREECVNYPRPDAPPPTSERGQRKLQTVTSATARELANALIDPTFITVNDPVLTCADGASGIVEFRGGVHAFEDEGLKDSTAVILTSGSAEVVTLLSNTMTGTTTVNGFPGDDDLTAVVEQETFDACSLQLSLGVAPGFFSVRLIFYFIFASEEYNEFVGLFNDGFALFIDGRAIDDNVALVPQTRDPITVDTVNEFENVEFFIDNEGMRLATEYDGFTKHIATEPIILTRGQQTSVKLVIGDAGDDLFDSAVVIRAFVAADRRD